MELQSESIKEITKALLKFQSFNLFIKKDAENPYFGTKYASLSETIKTIRKALVDCGLSFSQSTIIQDGNNILVTTLYHESGEWIRGYYALSPVRKDPQAEGSALSYARRYTLLSMLGIATEDDDGESATIHYDEEEKSSPKEKLATLNQKRLIQQLCQKYNEDELKMILTKTINKFDLSNLTYEDAHKLINELLLKKKGE